MMIRDYSRNQPHPGSIHAWSTDGGRTWHADRTSEWHGDHSGASYRGISAQELATIVRTFGPDRVSESERAS